MKFPALLALAFGMSMDAFAVALAKGVAMPKPSLTTALKTGLLFGVVESITPLIGYGLGRWAEDVVLAWDHWLSFVLLGGLGLHMLYEAIKSNQADADANSANPDPANPDIDATDSTNTNANPKPASTTKQRLLLITTAFATSIDAMIVGVTLAFLQVNIWLACLLIGLATTLMVTLGIYLGHRVGEKIGKWAEAFGGVVLIGIGTSILISHLAG